MRLGLGLSISPRSDGGAAAQEPHDWVMHYGAWNDAGIWDDDALWEDAFTPERLFFGDTEGVWYDGTDSAALSTDWVQSVSPAANGDDVERIRDLSGKGHDAVQESATRAVAWNIQTDTTSVLFDNVNVSADDPMTVQDVRFPIPTLPNRDYNIFMAVKAGPNFFGSQNIQGGFASNFVGGPGQSGHGSMLLLSLAGVDAIGTWRDGQGASNASAALAIPGNIHWRIVGMHAGRFRYDGTDAGPYGLHTQGQVAGLGGIGGQLGSFYMADVVAIDRALTAFELTLLETYMANKVNITLG